MVVDISAPYWMWEKPASHLPALLLIGRREVREAVYLEDHSHDEAFEFVYVERGQSSWEVDGEQFHTGIGDVFFARPGERHSGRYSVIEPCRFWWLQIQVPRQDVKDYTWLGLTKAETKKLSHALWLLPRVTHTAPEVSKLLHRLSHVLLQNDTLSRLEQRLLILEFLFALVHGQVSMTNQSENAALVRLATEILERDLAQRHSVKSLANAINVSPSHFHRIFRQEIGVTPMVYAERLRCREACRRLEETNEPITKIASDLGYATSQHFATAFKRITGRTPSQWRENKNRWE